MFLNILLTLFLATLLSPSSPHPQCLDFQPPFQENSLSYCTEYRDFGCCEADGDEAARERVVHAAAKASEEERQLCAPYLKNISCVTCSPYVAHIYETEEDGEPQAFPELCRSYCIETYMKCRLPLMRMFHMKPWRNGLVSAKHPENEEELARDARAFCEHYIPEDSPYCYPRVLDGPDIEGFSTEQVGELGCICGQPVATGLRNPLAAVHAGDGSGRLFIAEQIGVVRVLDKDNNLLPEPFLDMQSIVLTSSNKGEERGLLNMAFHPNYAENGLFYVCYSSSINNSTSHHSIVSEFHVNEDDPNTANLTSERVVLSISQPFNNHNGGQLLFKDGYLLVFLGDGGKAGDPLQNGQNLSTLLGAVLRIDVDHRDPGKEYAIPLDNPFMDDLNAQPEIYAYGVRNPWRCSIDRGDRETGEGAGRIFCGDVGQKKYEEVDIIMKGGNYGWNAFESHRCFNKLLCDNSSLSSTVIPPIHTYPHDRRVGVCVIGGYVYRGCAFPNLQGLYIFGDYGTGKVFALKENQTTGEWESMELCMGDSSVCTGSLVGEERVKHIISFGEDEDGELYILTTSFASPTAAAGVVYHIVDPARQTSPTNNCEDNAINVAPTNTAVMPTSSSTELVGSGEATPSSSSIASTHPVYEASSSNSAELYTTLGTRPTTASVTNTELPATNTPVPPPASVTDHPGTNIPVPPVVTDLPGTNIPVPPVVTDLPGTNTPVPPVVTDLPDTNIPIPPVVSIADTSSCEKCFLNLTSDICEKLLSSNQDGGSQSVFFFSVGLSLALILSHCVILCLVMRKSCHNSSKSVSNTKSLCGHYEKDLKLRHNSSKCGSDTDSILV